MNRRELLRYLGATCSTLLPWGIARSQTVADIVVVGGGFGGATAARYLRDFLPKARITLIEPNAEFISCPMSNRVLHGVMGIKDLTRSYESFAVRNQTTWLRDTVIAINSERRQVTTLSEKKVPYDRLVVAPGVDFNYSSLVGMETAASQEKILHAWKAGVQTVQLRDRLQAITDGSTVAMHIPKVPYRCPPGPYERASLIAFYLKQNKPKSKLLVFDANVDIQSKKELFYKAWKENYSDNLQYVPNAEVRSVDAGTNTVEFDFQGKVTAALWNIIPPQRAGRLALSSGLANVSGRWCGVDFRSYESTAQKDVHVIGDSIAGSPGMPKSAHMANQEAKVCAAAILQSLTGRELPKNIALANTCYSYVSQRDAMHVAAVFRYDETTRQMVSAKGAGGLSEEASALEAVYAMSWLSNILGDAFG
jgi:sulfide dehydrogenase [flavocytochrome c] flavoprotein chain